MDVIFQDFIMNEPCGNTQAEIENDMRSIELETRFENNKSELIEEVNELKSRWINRELEITDCYGDKFPLSELTVHIFDDNAFVEAIIDFAKGSNYALRTLVNEKAFKACAIHLYGEDCADKLIDSM